MFWLQDCPVHPMLRSRTRKQLIERLRNSGGSHDLGERSPFPILPRAQPPNTGVVCEMLTHTSRAALPSHSLASSVTGPSEGSEVRSFHLPSSYFELHIATEYILKGMDSLCRGPLRNGGIALSMQLIRMLASCPFFAACESRLDVE